MKQHISKEQAQTVTVRQAKALRDAGIGNYKDLTIGKMIEILGNKIKHIDRTTEGWEVCIEYMGGSMFYQSKELADALWEAVKATL